MTMNLTDDVIVDFYKSSHIKHLKSGIDKRYPNLSLVRIAAHYFERKEGRLLDYGCGFGANLIHLLETGFNVNAIDTSPYAIEKIKTKLSDRPELRKKASLHVLDSAATSLPFEDNTFDFVVCSSVLSLLSTPERIQKLMEEFRRVMRPGAKAYLDINGPESMFAVPGKSLGNDVYEYRGRDGQGNPQMIYCPSTQEKFKALVEPYLLVDEVGYHAHQFFECDEQEFIICARNEK